MKIQVIQMFARAPRLAPAKVYVLAAAVKWPGEVNMTRLARDLNISMGAVTGMVDGLQRMGLVRREGKPGDRRSHVVMITEAGRVKLSEFLLAVEAAAGVSEG